MELVEDGESRPPRCKLRMFEEPALLWKEIMPGLICEVGWRAAVAVVVMENSRIPADYSKSQSPLQRGCLCHLERTVKGVLVSSAFKGPASIEGENRDSHQYQYNEIQSKHLSATRCSSVGPVKTSIRGEWLHVVSDSRGLYCGLDGGLSFKQERWWRMTQKKGALRVSLFA